MAFAACGSGAWVMACFRERDAHLTSTRPRDPLHDGVADTKACIDRPFGACATWLQVAASLVTTCRGLRLGHSPHQCQQGMFEVLLEVVSQTLQAG